MKLTAPFMITARLKAGVQVDKSFISIEDAGTSKDGRTVYHYYLDTPEWEHDGSDLKSGVGGGGLQAGMESLLSFMSAAAETYRYRMHGQGDNDPDSFPPHVMEWCYQNDCELSMLALELNENPNLIEE